MLCTPTGSVETVVAVGAPSRDVGTFGAGYVLGALSLGFGVTVLVLGNERKEIHHPLAVRAQRAEKCKSSV